MIIFTLLGSSLACKPTPAPPITPPPVTPEPPVVKCGRNMSFNEAVFTDTIDTSQYEGRVEKCNWGFDVKNVEYLTMECPGKPLEDCKITASGVENLTTTPPAEGRITIDLIIIV